VAKKTVATNGNNFTGCALDIDETKTHLLEGVQDAHLDLLLDGLDLGDFFGIRHD